MSTQLQFIGSEQSWFETEVTGKSRGWRAGLIGEVSDGEAALLLATGKFRRSGAVPLNQPDPLTTEQVQAVQLDALGFGAFAALQAHVTKYNTHSEVGPDGTTPVAVVAPANMTHDLVQDASLLDPITGKSAAAFQIFVGQPLVPIPSASSAPYWTDPGQISHNANAGNIASSYPGLIEYITYKGRNVLRLRSPAGYGDAAGNGARRSQIRMPPISNRATYHWRIAFEIPDDDEPCWDAATKYAYPVLFWQIIGTQTGSLPLWSFILETTPDPNVFRLLSRFRYSGDNGTTTSYRRQGNAATGTFAANSDLYLCDVAVQRGREHKLDIVIAFDERSSTTEVYGWAKAWLDGAKIFDYGGPTYYLPGTVAATAGTLSCAHCTVYRFGYSRRAQVEGGNPTGVNELNLNSPNNPAPFTRVLHFYEWRMRRI